MSPNEVNSSVNAKLVIFDALNEIYFRTYGLKYKILRINFLKHSNMLTTFSSKESFGKIVTNYEVDVEFIHSSEFNFSGTIKLVKIIAPKYKKGFKVLWRFHRILNEEQASLQENLGHEGLAQ